MSTAPATRRTRKIPGYLLHKRSGQARVRLNGNDHYLGPYGSDESRQKYSVLIAEYCSGAVIGPSGQAANQDSGLTISEISLAYTEFAEGYYQKNGKQTDEVHCINSALRPLVDLYGNMLANPVDGEGGFGPIALKAVRQKMIQADWTRRYINMSVGRIRRMFKWAIENELVDERILVRLKAVAPLMAGRTEAKEHSPRGSVSKSDVERVKKKVPARTRDMIDLWLLTGARPGELVKLTGEMIDRTTCRKQKVWVAELSDHKRWFTRISGVFWCSVRRLS